MNTIFLHLERLRRHYEAAANTYDQVSFLDLSHSLRIWSELKEPLKVLSPNFATAMAFKTAIPAKKVLKAAKGVPYVFSYMPGGVLTYASNGQLISGRPMSGDFTAAISLKVTPPKAELGKYCVIEKSFEQHLIKALDTEQVTRCNYIQWLGAEAVRVSYINKNTELRTITISREMIIKRVANTLDGSHPSASGSNDQDNMFDEPIHYLLEYKAGGLSLPYFILLKIAQDILAVAPRLLGQKNEAVPNT